MLGWGGRQQALRRLVELCSHLLPWRSPNAKFVLLTEAEKSLQSNYLLRLPSKVEGGVTRHNHFLTLVCYLYNMRDNESLRYLQAAQGLLVLCKGGAEPENVPITPPSSWVRHH